MNSSRKNTSKNRDGASLQASSSAMYRYELLGAPTLLHRHKASYNDPSHFYNANNNTKIHQASSSSSTKNSTKLTSKAEPWGRNLPQSVGSQQHFELDCFNICNLLHNANRARIRSYYSSNILPNQIRKKDVKREKKRRSTERTKKKKNRKNRNELLSKSKEELEAEIKRRIEKRKARQAEEHSTSSSSSYSATSSSSLSYTSSSSYSAHSFKRDKRLQPNTKLWSYHTKRKYDSTPYVFINTKKHHFFTDKIKYYSYEMKKERLLSSKEYVAPFGMESLLYCFKDDDEKDVISIQHDQKISLRDEDINDEKSTLKEEEKNKKKVTFDNETLTKQEEKEKEEKRKLEKLLPLQNDDDQKKKKYFKKKKDKCLSDIVHRLLSKKRIGVNGYYQRESLLEEKSEDNVKLFGNGLLLFSCTCCFCTNSANSRNKNKKSVYLLHPSGDALDHVSFTKLNFPNDDHDTDENEEVKQVHVGGRVLQLVSFGRSNPRTASTTKKIHYYYIARTFTHVSILSLAQAQSKNEEKINMGDQENADEKEEYCVGSYQLVEIARIDLRAKNYHDNSDENDSKSETIGYIPIHITAPSCSYPSDEDIMYHPPTFCILSQPQHSHINKEDNKTKQEVTIHHVTITNPIQIRRHVICDLKHVLQIEFDGNHPMILWALGLPHYDGSVNAYDCNHSFPTPTKQEEKEENKEEETQKKDQNQKNKKHHLNSIFISTPKQNFPYYGNGYSLYKINLHTNTSTFIWSPSHEEFAPHNVHSLSSLYIDDTPSSHSVVWTSSKTAGKTWCIDVSLRKARFRWSIPTLCDDYGSITPRDGLYGNGALFVQPFIDLCRDKNVEKQKVNRHKVKDIARVEHEGEKDTEKKLVDKSHTSSSSLPATETDFRGFNHYASPPSKHHLPTFAIHKHSTSWGIHLYQTPLTLPRLGTRGLECSSCPDDIGANSFGVLGGVGGGEGLAWSSSFPLPDVSSDGMVFTTGLAVLRIPSCRILNKPTMDKIFSCNSSNHDSSKLENKQNKHDDNNDNNDDEENAMLVVLTMTNRGDMYTHTLLECPRNSPRLENVQAFDGLSVGTAALAIPLSFDEEKQASPYFPTAPIKNEDGAIANEQQQQHHLRTVEGDNSSKNGLRVIRSNKKSKKCSSSSALYITVSNEFPTPSHAISPCTVATRDECRPFRSVPLEHIPNFHWAKSTEKYEQLDNKLETFENTGRNVATQQSDNVEAVKKEEDGKKVEENKEKKEGNNDGDEGEKEVQVIAEASHDTHQSNNVEMVRVGVENHEQGRHILEDTSRHHEGDQGGTLLQQHQQQEGTPFVNGPMEMCSIHHPTADMGLGSIQPYAENHALHPPQGQHHQQKHLMNLRSTPLLIPSDYTTVNRPRLRMPDHSPGSWEENQDKINSTVASSTSSTSSKTSRTSRSSKRSRTSTTTSSKSKKQRNGKTSRIDIDKNTVLELESLWGGIKVKKDDDSNNGDEDENESIGSD